VALARSHRSHTGYAFLAANAEPPPARAQARHLLHVFPGFGVGGSQMRFVALADALGDSYVHTVLSLSGRFEAAEFLTRRAPVRLLDGTVVAGSLPNRILEYRRLVRRLAPDLLVTYNWGAIEPALANLAGRTPHLHFEDGFGPEEAERQLPRRVWTRRLALARSDVVVPSHTLRTLATKVWRLNGRRVRHIPNGVRPRRAFATTLAELGLALPSGRVRIAWVGALRPEKNPARLLRAFGSVKDDAVLLLIGDGPEREALEAEVSRLGLAESVRFLGARDDARDIIMQCDVLALSSDTEQMPLVVLEAMDAGLPVVSTDVGDVRRMVAEPNRPYVTPCTDEGLAAALTALVRAPSARAEIGAANRRKAGAEYSFDTMAAAYAALFDSLAGQSR
jgi:glycosyltransferase involved in cell wall biosynthesis